VPRENIHSFQINRVFFKKRIKEEDTVKAQRTLAFLCISIMLLGYSTTASPPTRAAQQQTGSIRASYTAELSNASTAPQSPAAVGWHTELVDQPNTSAAITDHSLQIDSAGQPHVAYGGDHLHYAWRDVTGWQYVTVTGTITSSYPSLALDSSGNPHISYRSANGLEHAYWTGSAWNVQTVDGAGNKWTSIDLDDANSPHIAYYASGALKYARWTGSTWDLQTVDSENGGWPSIALDNANYPHIGYGASNYNAYNASAIEYARWTGSAWDLQTVDDTEEFVVASASAPSMALDISNEAHIAHSMRVGSVIHSYLLRYAHSSGSAWSIETLGTSGAAGPYDGISLDVNAGNNPHISYAQALHLYHTFWSGSAWEKQVIGSEQPTITSLALDAADKPHVIHYDGNSLRYSYQPPPPTLHKAATPSEGLHVGDTLTYTLTFSGVPASAQLWDPLPDSIDYITGSITSTVTPAAVYSPTAHAIVWQGTLTDTAQTIRFQVTPVVSTTGGLAPPSSTPPG
jgi:hypothetical protein